MELVLRRGKHCTDWCNIMVIVLRWWIHCTGCCNIMYIVHFILAIVNTIYWLLKHNIDRPEMVKKLYWLLNHNRDCPKMVKTLYWLLKHNRDCHAFAGQCSVKVLIVVCQVFKYRFTSINKYWRHWTAWQVGILLWIQNKTKDPTYGLLDIIFFIFYFFLLTFIW